MVIVRDCDSTANYNVPTHLASMFGQGSDYLNGAEFDIYSGTSNSQEGLDGVYVVHLQTSGTLLHAIGSYGSDCHPKLLAVTYGSDGLTFWVNGLPMGTDGVQNVNGSASFMINAYVGSAGGTIISGGKGNVYGKLSLYNSEITSAYMWQAMNAAGI